jgi:hypothetical protein
MISAGVVRTILADMIKLYFEHKTAVGKGVLVFNPVQPELSNYLTVKDLENDLAVAQESMNRELEELFELIIKVIQKEDRQRTSFDSDDPGFRGSCTSHRSLWRQIKT